MNNWGDKKTEYVLPGWAGPVGDRVVFVVAVVTVVFLIAHLFVAFLRSVQ